MTPLTLVFWTLQYTFCGISIVASIFLLSLHSLNKQRKGIFQPLMYMALYQILLDIGLMIPFSSRTLTFLSAAGQIIGGIVSGLYSNVIGLIAVYVIAYRNVFELENYFPLVDLICILPSLATFIVFAFGVFEPSLQLVKISILYMNFYIRLISIFLNFFCYAYTAFLVHRLVGEGKQSNSMGKDQNEAILSLVSRLKYYPLVQAIARSGPSLDRAINGVTDLNTDDVSPIKIYNAVTVPSAGLGYFLVYLLMQPQAWNDFKNLICCRYISSSSSSSSNPTSSPSLSTFQPATQGRKSHMESGTTGEPQSLQSRGSTWMSAESRSSIFAMFARASLPLWREASATSTMVSGDRPNLDFGLDSRMSISAPDPRSDEELFSFIKTSFRSRSINVNASVLMSPVNPIHSASIDLS
jgi:hypothetical protein